MGRPVPDSLRREGQAMLAAVAADFQRCPGVEVSTLLEDGREGLLPPGIELHRVRPGKEDSLFRSLARAADYTLVIAPECAGILAERCICVEQEGGHLLGPSAEAVQLAGDKLRLGQGLAEAGVPTPKCFLLPARGVTFPAVCKPRFGAGSQATFLVRNGDELQRALGAARAEESGEVLVQPFVLGQPASVAVLVGKNQTVALPPATQDLSADGRFHYRGGHVPIAPRFVHRAQTLAERAVARVAGLCGYVGVDLVLGEEVENDTVIEINPRLTTSYVGLRALAEFNLAEAMLALARNRELPAMQWKTGEVRFKANGSIRFQEMKNPEPRSQIRE
jgi:predicted ATP-grasp superfamily ATP-dependent carboligase